MKCLILAGGFGARRYAEARYLKILWWKSWKEKNLTQASSHGQLKRHAVKVKKYRIR